MVEDCLVRPGRDSQPTQHVLNDAFRTESGLDEAAIKSSDFTLEMAMQQVRKFLLIPSFDRLLDWLIDLIIDGIDLLIIIWLIDWLITRLFNNSVSINVVENSKFGLNVFSGEVFNLLKKAVRLTGGSNNNKFYSP